jgi:cysteinyl-tRNA synthetase
MEIRLYDTKEKKKVVFKPINPKDIKFYVCGPTVYDRAHIGNARPAVVFDLLFRFLRYVFDKEFVTYVRNFTDIDDKINKQSADTGRSIDTITNETIQWYKEDMFELNVLDPNESPRATDYIDPMINQIEILIKNKHAYSDDNGHVFFSVNSFPKYGLLSKRNLDEMEAGSRVAVTENKADPMDFVLWKPSDDQTPGWKSPWGRGRPGWHIECSAMIYELLGTDFDIHGGGIDLAFPHHENELAQSSCAYPSGRFANIWMHNGFLQIEGEKMSKSLGNFFTVKDLINKGISGEVIRMVLMSTHYRQPLDWTSQRVMEVSKILTKWRGLCKSVMPAKFPSKEILDALADDLNTPLVFTKLHKLAATGKFSELLGTARFLGLLLSDKENDGSYSVLSEYQKVQVENLIAERLEAKKEKDFIKADLIRKNLEVAGIAIMDQTDGTDWSIRTDFDIKKMEDLI